MLTLRLDYMVIFKNPYFKHPMLQGTAWEVRLKAYTFFYIPLCEVRIFIDDKTLQPLCESIKPTNYKWPRYWK